MEEEIGGLDEWAYSRPELGYSAENFKYLQEMYEPDMEETFTNLLNVSAIPEKPKQLLKLCFNYAISKDIILANRSIRQADIDIKRLSLRLDSYNLSLHGEDLLATLTPDWDNCANFILAVMQTRIERSIDGFERKMQNTRQVVSSTESTFTNKNHEITDKKFKF